MLFVMQKNENFAFAPRKKSNKFREDYLLQQICLDIV